jgi:hypothetical protein
MFEMERKNGNDTMEVFMEQQGLPGFPANSEKAAKLRRLQNAKGLEVVLSLAKSLERLLAPEAAIAGELGVKPKRQRGRPRIQRPNEEAPPAGQAAPEKLRVVIPAPPVPDYKDMNILFSRFKEACIFPDPEAVTPATKIYVAFCTWFSKEFPGRRQPTQHMLGRQLKQVFTREKHGTYQYYGLRVAQ